MNHARIEQLGTPMDLYDQPKTRFAADFIGQSNLIDGHMQAAGQFQVGQATIPVHPQDDAPAAGSEATLMVRPEAVELVSPGQGWLSGTVSEAVFLGSEVRAVVTLEQADDAATSAAFIARCGRERQLALGDRVGLHWDLARSRVLRA